MAEDQYLLSLLSDFPADEQLELAAQILESVQNGIIKTGGEKLPEHVLHGQPALDKIGQLAERLPFAKDCQAVLHKLHEGRDMVVDALRRTHLSREWFDRACEQDKERDSSIGTLGYLPWEVRDQVWNHLAYPEWDYAWSSPSFKQPPGHLIIEDYGSKGDGAYYRVMKDSDRHPFCYEARWDYAWCYRTTDLQYHRSIFGKAGNEIYDAFLQTYIFYFSDPTRLQKFLDVVENRFQPRFRLHLAIHISYNLDAEIATWDKTLATLPLRTRSVFIEMGSSRANEQDRMAFELLVETVKERALTTRSAFPFVTPAPDPERLIPKHSHCRFSSFR